MSEGQSGRADPFKGGCDKEGRREPVNFKDSRPWSDGG